MSAPDKITTSRCCKQIVQSGMNEWPSDVEYTRSDLIPAMLTQAYAEGRSMGEREARETDWNDAIHAAIHAVRGLDFEYTEPVLLALRDLLRKDA